MKKYIFTIAALVLGISQMSAQKLVFGDVDLPLGGQATLTVKYETGGESLTTASFTLTLPDGVTSEKTSAGKSKFVVNADMAESFTAYTTDKDGFSVAATTTGVEFPGTSGVLGTVTLIAAADAANLEIGESYPVTVSGLTLVKRTDAGLVSIPFDNVTFNVNIIENITTLDENSTTAPEAAENVDVKVLRTISVSNWNTICLPFAMTGKQVEEAFGADVEFADFTGYESTYDGRDCTEIKVNFNSTTASVLSNGLSANHPCLIKVNSPISEFIVRGVNISPAAKPVVTGNTGQRYCDMYGVYVKTMNMGDARSPYLFLSGNKFYYATGRTTMKAFRAYFDLYDYLTDMSASSKIGYIIDGEASFIDGLVENRIVEGVYDLSGRKIKLEDGDVTKLQKGVYIIDGKKVTIK